ncbi:MAG: hypothetical protein LBQ38_10935 [Spirochaetaceae bacterium]|jgi:hypothetical protein|nr:hypothetical protein [Spirochaetaceae bacterium]
MWRIKTGGILLFPILGFLFLSCATTNPYAGIDNEVYRGNYEDGLAAIDGHKKNIYRDKDLILYHLDKGMVNHYARRYEDSIQNLQDGERAIEEAYTKSITMEIGSYILNDRTREYDGEDYEDIYINAFNALNYYHLRNTEDALVEIRRMNNKLQFLSSKYGVITSNLQKQALESSAAIPYDPESATVQFSDSALARYLGLLFYRGIGQYDDARIDRDHLKLAFANAPSVYTYPPPQSLEEELEIPPGKARLNVIGFSGLSPVKVEETVRIPLPNERWVKIALPVMEYRPSLVSRIEVRVNEDAPFVLELLEDIEAVARETFKEKVGLIYFKSVLRAVTKGLTSSVLSGASEEVGGQAGLALWLVSLGTQAFAEASERADLRISRYFPAKAWVGGINLDPGVYTLHINYYAANGRLLATYIDDQVTVREGALNLAEAVCVR